MNLANGLSINKQNVFGRFCFLPMYSYHLHFICDGRYEIMRIEFNEMCLFFCVYVYL